MLLAPLLEVYSDEYHKHLPIVDGKFTSADEWDQTKKIETDEGSWLFYDYFFYIEQEAEEEPQYVYVVAVLHYFREGCTPDSGWDRLESYDANMFSYILPTGDTVEAWIFQEGDCNCYYDSDWLENVGITNATPFYTEPPPEPPEPPYPCNGTGFPDDGGFLVRFNGDPDSDRLVTTLPDGTPGPFGINAMAGFNSSAVTNGYDEIEGELPDPEDPEDQFEGCAREIYEITFTYSTDTPPINFPDFHWKPKDWKCLVPCGWPDDPEPPYDSTWDDNIEYAEYISLYLSSENAVFKVPVGIGEDDYEYRTYVVLPLP